MLHFYNRTAAVLGLRNSVLYFCFYICLCFNLFWAFSEQFSEIEDFFLCCCCRFNNWVSFSSFTHFLHFFSPFILNDCTREAFASNLANRDPNFTSAVVNASVTGLHVKDASGVKFRCVFFFFFLIPWESYIPKKKKVLSETPHSGLVFWNKELCDSRSLLLVF